MADTAERLLLEGLRQGDPEAWEQIVRTYSGRLLAFARSQLSRSVSDAEDLVQEAFCALVAQREQAQRIRSLQAFLFQVLRRKIIDLRRKKRPETLTESRWKKQALSPAQTPSGRISLSEQQARAEEALLEALASYLQEVKRTCLQTAAVLELLFVKGKSGKETARRFALTEVQVSRIKHALVRYLKERLAEQEALPEHTIGELWSENLLTCLKRSALGAYQVGILPQELAHYIKFHLEVIGCPYCRANLQDMRSESLSLPKLQERILATSTPFLKPRRSK